MSGPVTKPGWYKLGPGGLEWHCGLDEEPDGEAWELVQVEVATVVEEPLF